MKRLVLLLLVLLMSGCQVVYVNTSDEAAPIAPIDGKSGCNKTYNITTIDASGEDGNTIKDLVGLTKDLKTLGFKASNLMGDFRP